MRLFGYYALHSFLNQLKKLFKTWVAILVVVCLLFGVVIGVGAALLAEHFEGEEPTEEYEKIEEPADSVDSETILQAVELGCGGLFLLLFAFSAVRADKSGSAVFLPADVTLLFSAPMKPQSVLLFRMTTQFGAMAIASIYLLFQLPNLVLNVGLPLWSGLALIPCWFFMLAFTKMIELLLFIIGSTNTGIKKKIRPIVYLLFGILILTFFLFSRKFSGGAITPLAAFEAGCAFFNAPLTRMIPVWGWLKGAVLAALTENWLAYGLSMIALGAFLILFVMLIWKVKTDFYEDALAKTDELAAMARAAEDGNANIIKRKKERKDSLWRDRINHGWGANVYFYKSLYNRFRFGHFHVLTKTAETYLVTATAVAYITRFVIGKTDFLPVALVLGGIAFFRSLGNPIAQDTAMDSFLLIPENTFKKLFFCLTGGTVNSLLDLIPALTVSAILLRTNPLTVLLSLVLILSVDLYSSAVGLFIDLSVPISAAKTIKSVIQILFIYFGLLPDAIILIVGALLDVFAFSVIPVTLLNILLGSAFFAFCPLILDKGRK